ncbi:hypothetical protein [Epibacterium ulvae]|uniref:hypothetical protein n=1 Tax=Epibacterium ulvae TaxID=1156985 RepID=UPI0024926A4E|nr:hypothetical protein [Epibacterium ulvae]
MQIRRIPKSLALSLVVMIAMGAQYFDLAIRFGAHPWWATQVLWLGVLLGICAGALGRYLSSSPMKPFTICLVVIGIAVLSTAFGKQGFATSFGDNKVAGQFWYFGWIMTCTSITAALILLPFPLQKKSK